MSNPRVEQTGDMTPGHLATWTTTGVIQDGGAVPSGGGGNGGGGGGSAITGLLNYATPADAESAVIPDNTNFITVAGFKTPGDGGAATYGRVSSLPSSYAGDGTATPFVPPSFTSGGLPTLCYATTQATFSLHSGIIGPITQPIIAGSLAFLTVIFWGGPNTLPNSISDSAGNVYVQAVNSEGGGFSIAALFYCVNPVFAPIGTTLVGLPLLPFTINIYSVPGFTGALLDQTATAFDTSPYGMV
jgi:hypothetical protein